MTSFREQAVQHYQYFMNVPRSGDFPDTVRSLTLARQGHVQDRCSRFLAKRLTHSGYYVFVIYDYLKLHADGKLELGGPFLLQDDGRDGEVIRDEVEQQWRKP